MGYFVYLKRMRDETNNWKGVGRGLSSRNKLLTQQYDCTIAITKLIGPTKSSSMHSIYIYIFIELLKDINLMLLIRKHWKRAYCKRTQDDSRLTWQAAWRHCGCQSPQTVWACSVRTSWRWNASPRPADRHRPALWFVCVCCQCRYRPSVAPVKQTFSNELEPAGVQQKRMNWLFKGKSNIKLRYIFTLS